MFSKLPKKKNLLAGRVNAFLKLSSQAALPSRPNLYFPISSQVSLFFRIFPRYFSSLDAEVISHWWYWFPQPPLLPTLTVHPWGFESRCCEEFTQALVGAREDPAGRGQGVGAMRAALVGMTS